MVALFLADGFEEIEALVVVDILRRANIEIETVSISNETKVTGSHKIPVIADKTIGEIDKNKYECFILPGGLPGTTNLGNSKTVTEVLLWANNQKKYIAAICAAPSVLGKLNILNGKNATCYPGYETELLGANRTNEKVVTDSNVVTSKGAGTAHDFAFELVKILKDEKTAEDIKNAMQY